MSELRTLISSTFHGSFNAEGTFSAIRSLKTGGKRIFLYFDYAKSSHSSLRIFKVILNLLIKQSLSSESRHKTYFMLDEFSLLPRLDRTLIDGLSFGRDPSGSNKGGGFRIIIAIQSAQLLTNSYTQQETATLLSLFPNIICLRVSDSFSRSVLADRFGNARYSYNYPSLGEKIITTDAVEPVLSDYVFSKITQKGDAIMSLPALCGHPFIYHGHREEEISFETILK